MSNKRAITIIKDVIEENEKYKEHLYDLSDENRNSRRNSQLVEEEELRLFSQRENVDIAIKSLIHSLKILEGYENE